MKFSRAYFFLYSASVLVIPLAIFVLSSSIQHYSNRFDISEFEEVIFVTRKMPKDGHWYANFGYYSFDENNKLYEEGSSLCKLDVKSGELEVLFEDEKGTYRDPQLHYDGNRILFSYRKGGEEHFHLYETDVQASFLRQITYGPYSDIEPTYLPDGDIIFVSTRCECWVNCWSTQVATLHRCKPDGSEIRKISANIEHDNTPWMLPNGQVVYTRWEYVDRSQVHFHHLWVMNPDGSKQTVLYGNQTTSFDDPNSCLLIDAKPVPWSSDTIMATYSPGHGRKEHAGYPVLISLTSGPDDRNALVFLRGKQKKELLYDPFPINRDLYMASQERSILLFDKKGNTNQLFELPKDHLNGSQNIFEPRPVMKKKHEPIIASHLTDQKDYGTIIMQNVYEGRNMSEVKKGSITDLLVLETLRKPINFTGGNEPLSYTGSFTMERIVGKVPVHEDGSAHFKLKANRPYLFVALDETGSAVQKMKSFASVAPGEVVSCIGCHEKRSHSPVNRGQIPEAMTREATFPKPVEGLPTVIDFPRDIQPILDKHCIKCHNPDERNGGILLTGDRGPVYAHSYFNLMAHFQVNDGLNHSYALNKPGMVGDKRSPLIEKVSSGHGEVKLSDEEILKIKCWINTGALYPGTYAALGTGMVGRMLNNNPDRSSVENEIWDAASSVIINDCRSCHRELMPDIIEEKNLTWWRSRVDVTSGKIDQNKYKEAIRFSRHAIYNLDNPQKSTILLAPLSKISGGHGLCRNKRGKAIFESTSSEGYQSILKAIDFSSEYFKKIKRFDDPDFTVSPDYFREMKRYGVLEDDVKIEDVDPYKTDSIYWELSKN